jgi:hypothetical protein
VINKMTKIGVMPARRIATTADEAVKIVLRLTVQENTYHQRKLDGIHEITLHSLFQGVVRGTAAAAPGVEGIRVSGVSTWTVRDACNPGDWGVSIEPPTTMPPSCTVKVTGTSNLFAMVQVISTGIAQTQRQKQT